MSIGAKQHAVVTGGASGIGRAAAKALEAQGYRITIFDRADPGVDGWNWVEVDLDAMAGACPDVGGPVDVLVNAAGLPPRAGTEAVVLRVNFLALRRLTIALMDAMPRGGRIVNMASKAGAKWRENLPQVERLLSMPDDAELEDFVEQEGIDPVRSYDLSKEAVVVWTKVMTATLLARDLRMNAVSPGAVETPILTDFIDAFGERAVRGMKMTKGTGQADDIADVIAFLASPASRWLRGCNIEADGGLSAMLDAEKLIGWQP